MERSPRRQRTPDTIRMQQCRQRQAAAGMKALHPTISAAAYSRLGELREVSGMTINEIVDAAILQFSTDGRPDPLA